MKIAVASSDGNVVDVHFGKATSFYIYSLDSDMKIMVDKRTIPNYCQGDAVKDTHSYDPSRLVSIVEVIDDCDAIYVKKIGEKPKKELEKMDFVVIEFSGLISEI